MHFHLCRSRRAFTAVEALLIIGIIGMTVLTTRPLLQKYRARTNVQGVAQQTIDALLRAQKLAIANEAESAWGYHVSTGTLYKGSSFADRDTLVDEEIPVPADIATSGLSEVSFSKLGGVPNAYGDIVLTSVLGESRTITIAVDGITSSSADVSPTVNEESEDEEAVAGPRMRIEVIGTSTPIGLGDTAVPIRYEDWIDLTTTDTFAKSGMPGVVLSRHKGYIRVLHDAQDVLTQANVRIVFEGARVSEVRNDSKASALENVDDRIVHDGVQGDEVMLSMNASVADVYTRVSDTDTDAVFLYWEELADEMQIEPVSVHSNACSADLSVAQGRIVLEQDADVHIRVERAEANYGAEDGPEINLLVYSSLDSGTTRESLFHYVDVDGGEQEVLSLLDAGSALTLIVEGRYSWLFRKEASTGDGTGRVTSIKNDDGSVTVSVSIEDSDDHDDLVLRVSAVIPGCTNDDKSQKESAGGEHMIICHMVGEPETKLIAMDEWAEHLFHGDTLRSCQDDTDGDGIANAIDRCPGTYFPESVPLSGTLGEDRYALGQDSVFVEDITLETTHGCSCEQLIEMQRDVFGFSKKKAREMGCTREMLIGS